MKNYCLVKTSWSFFEPLKASYSFDSATIELHKEDKYYGQLNYVSIRSFESSPTKFIHEVRDIEHISDIWYGHKPQIVWC